MALVVFKSLTRGCRLVRCLAYRASGPRGRFLKYSMEMDPQYRKKIFKLRQRRTAEEGDRHGLQEASGWLWLRQLEKSREIKRERVQEPDLATYLLDPAIQSFACPKDVSGQIRAEVGEIHKMLADLPNARNGADDAGRKRDVMRDPNHLSRATGPNQRHLPLSDADRAHLASLRLLTESAEDPLAAEILRKRQALPAWSARQRILDAVSSHQVVLVSGDTGCGKSTQIPQYILDAHIEGARHQRGKLRRPFIVCTQPRRVSTVALASRVAEERLESVGRTIGWTIRHESLYDPSFCLLQYCTTGIVLQKLKSDPQLSSTTHLIIDEVHERSVNTDLLVTLVKELVRTRRDLKVLLMSATVNASKFSDYFSGCPIVEIPVEELHLEDLLAGDLLSSSDLGTSTQEDSRSPAGKKKSSVVKLATKVLRGSELPEANVLELLAEGGNSSSIPRCTAALIANIHRKYPMENGHAAGAILAFLPGWELLQKTKGELVQRLDAGEVEVHLLHSKLSSLAQSRVFEPPSEGARKVILATDIAETSVTINDIVYVVDSGLHNQRGYDSSTLLASLDPDWIPKSSARQRQGRAGRVRPGMCFRLYTRSQFEQFAEFPVPEIRAVPLESVLISLLSMGERSCEKFLGRTPDPPDMRAVRSALGMLRNLGACERNSERLTSLGTRLGALPIQPQVRHSSASLMSLLMGLANTGSQSVAPEPSSCALSVARLLSDGRQLGKLILIGALLGLQEPALTIASCYGTNRLLLEHGKASEVQLRNRLDLAGKHRESDALLLLRLYEEWVRLRRKERDTLEWARRYGVSISAMESVHLLRNQLARILEVEGLVSRPRAPEKRSSSRTVLQAIVSGCLWPNLARSDYQLRGVATIKGSLSTRQESSVRLHSSSIMSHHAAAAKQHWLAFTDKVKLGDNVQISGVNAASPHALVLFSDRAVLKPALDARFATMAERRLSQLHAFVEVADWVSFAVQNHHDAIAAGELRRAFSQVANIFFRLGATKELALVLERLQHLVTSFLEIESSYGPRTAPTKPPEERAGAHRRRSYRRAAVDLDNNGPVLQKGQSAELAPLESSPGEWL